MASNLISDLAERKKTHKHMFGCMRVCTHTHNIMHLIIMELGRFFVRTNLGNHAEASQQTRSECRSAIRRVSSAGFPCESLRNEGFAPTRHTLL